MLWWFAQDLVIATALAALVYLACRAWRLDPVARHALWLIVLAKLVTPPLVVWPWTVPNTWQGEAAQPAHAAAACQSCGTPTPGALPAPPTVTQKVAGQKSEIRGQSSEIDQPQVADAVTEPNVSDDVATDASVTRQPVEARADVAWTPLVPPPAEAAAAEPVEPAGPRWPVLVRRAVIGIWIAGSVAFLLVQCVRIFRMTRRLRRAAPADAALAQRVASLSERLQIRAVPIRIVCGISSPAIWAVARPTLLWPAELSLELPDRALDGLIVHELAHARRRDHWVGWLELLAGCVWWWNPLFWFVRHQVRENAELACDAWVVDTIPKGRRAYAEALLAVCEQLTGRPVPAPALSARTEGRRFLERRLAMILREHFPLRLRRFRLLATLLLALTSLPAWAQKAPPAHPEPATITVTGVICAPLQSTAGLPPQAATLLDQFKMQQEDARRGVITKLKAMEARAQANGSLDQARAIRRAIQDLQPAPAADQPLADPGTLTEYRGQIGKSYLFEVTGSTDGHIWGSGIYTDDSPLATAAVHAGLLKPGQKGIVRVTIQPALASYEGSTQNGVVSDPYDAFDGSYTVGPSRPRVSSTNLHSYWGARQLNNSTIYEYLHVTPAKEDKVLQSRDTLRLLDPTDEVKSNLPIGTRYTVEVVGSTTGSVCGNGIYVTGCSLSTAAVHCGVLGAGEKGVVTVTVLPGQATYEGATRNGVTSEAWGASSRSFVVQKTTPIVLASPPLLYLAEPLLGKIPDASTELQRELASLDGYRNGNRSEEKFAELEWKADELLKKYTARDDQARIYYQVAHIAAQSDIRSHVERVRTYATKSLALSRDPLQRALLYSYLGSAAEVDESKAFADRRRQAAGELLAGYAEMLARGLPKVAPELPPVDIVDNEDQPDRVQNQARHAAQMAAREEAEFIRDLVWRRDTLADQLKGLYRPDPKIYGRSPDGPEELRNLARGVLPDSAAVDALLTRVTGKDN